MCADGKRMVKIKNRILTVSAVLLATGFWFFDSSVHYFVYGEPEFEIIPGEFNELWMRTFIAALIFSFGVFADYFTNKISSRDKLLELTCVYNDLLHANLDVLNNQFDQMKLFKLEAQRSNDFDPEIVRLYDNSLAEISVLIESLTRVVDETDTEINTQLEVVADPGNAYKSAFRVY